MMETPVVLAESQITLEQAVKVDVVTEQPLPEQSTPTIYAAYWHARSGFFNLASNPPKPWLNR